MANDGRIDSSQAIKNYLKRFLNDVEREASQQIKEEKYVANQLKAQLAASRNQLPEPKTFQEYLDWQMHNKAQDKLFKSAQENAMLSDLQQGAHGIMKGLVKYRNTDSTILDEANSFTDSEEESDSEDGDGDKSSVLSKQSDLREKVLQTIKAK